MKSTYPAGPESVPANLTSLPFSYKIKATLAVLSILLFFALYFALVAASAWLVFIAFTYPVETINKLTVIMKIGAIAGSAMLFVFTLKFIFKLKNHRPENRIKLEKKDYPEIWDFVFQICRDTGAPRPKAIYADPDVNAYVTYSNMWLSLIFPVRKELTIGLGLIDCLSLTEFKAVTAHEFGHFAQSSMKIGSYIGSANTIIHDMIYSRDKWDETLARWRQTDLRLSFAAWLITPVIWIIRQVLFLFYIFLNVMHSTLSREMEFNADKVAVSVTGSNAIVSSLWKLDFGFSSWSSTLHHAYLASQKKMFVKNLYHHNGLCLERSAPLQRTLMEVLPSDAAGNKKYFQGSETSKVSMYASHPPNVLRENNAKQPYVSCDVDERSAWILFPDKARLQEEATLMIYSQNFNKKPKEFVSGEEFEMFIVSETSAGALLEEYHNTFEGRFLYVPTVAEMETADVTKDLDALKAELNLLMKPVREIEAAIQKVQEIAGGTSKETSVAYKGIEYPKKKMQDAYNVMIEDREKLFKSHFRKWDIEFCAYHIRLAKSKNKDSELSALLNQHNELSSFFRFLLDNKVNIIQKLQALQSRDDLTETDIHMFSNTVRTTIDELNKRLERFNTLKFVALPNISNVKELREAITNKGRFEKELGNLFENGVFDRVMQELDSAQAHCQRIDQKSLGEILSFAKALQEEKHDAARQS